MQHKITGHSTNTHFRREPKIQVVRYTERAFYCVKDLACGADESKENGRCVYE